jgi:LEA14-like dessication related protein
MDTKSSKPVQGKLRIGFIILIVVMLSINIIFGALIFLDLRLLKTPETTIQIELIEVNPDEVVIYQNIEVYNPNTYELFVENFKVITNTENGDEIARIIIEGGNIPSKDRRNFSSNEIIAFQGKGQGILTSKITGTIGVKFLGLIKKTLPLSVNIITSAEEVINEIEIPIVHVWGDFGEITTERINFTGTIEVYNPNSFEMFIEDLYVIIETETGEKVGSLEVEGGTIQAKSSKSFKGNGSVLIVALNAETLIVNITSTAGIKIAGITKSISYSVNTHINIPKIEDIINLNTPTDAIIKSDLRATLNGFVSDIELEIKNPNKIAIIARDIVFSIYRIDKEERELIGDCTIEEGEVGPEENIVLEAKIPISYRNLVFSRGKGFLPDALLIMVRANITIPGLDQHIWVGVSGYQDMHPFF